MKVMIIDGNSIVNRAYYGIRPLTNKDGVHTHAIYGFLSTYLRLQEQLQPDRTAVCFDVRAKTFRHKAFDSYKATRKGMPDELAEQMPLLKEVLTAMGIVLFEQEGYEADDLIGTMSVQLDNNGDEAVIVTGDRDSLQLVTDRVTVHLITGRSGQDSDNDYTPARFHEDYGFAPAKMVDLKSLMGDSSDNISGVAGIGEKTAMDLLHRFGSLEGIYENIEDAAIKKGAREKLKKGEQDARDSFWLASICTEAPLPHDPTTLPDAFVDEETLYNLLMQLELRTMITRLGVEGTTASLPLAQAKPPLTYTELPDADAALTYLRAHGQCVCAVAFTPAYDAFSLCIAEESPVVMCETMCTPEEWREILRRLFALSPVFADAMPHLVWQLEQDLPLQKATFDLALAAYLCSPTDNNYALERLVSTYLHTELPKITFTADIFGMLSTERNHALFALASQADAIATLYPLLLEQITTLQMEKLYYEMELPLTAVLAKMQVAGCLVDATQLSAFGVMLDARIAELTASIYARAGCDFNIQSPKQLGEVLFDKLSLPAKKKTKSGYSTNVEVLESLRGYDPIVGEVLEYRQLTKLKSTYVVGLLKVISPMDGRIHSHFRQTVTATGRLSSTEPNLQNIPVRTALGREMRRMFVAREGYTLVDADYSQIELRVLAHVAGDAAMIAVFAHGLDVHAATAAKVYGIPVEEVTPDQRSSCKAVNFGIVYGISDFALSVDLNITRKQAGEFIQSYLDTYPMVGAYMNNIKAQAHADGFVTTMFGRRRVIPELKASNFNLRSFGERAAMNTPIQGAAADIIKLAMLRVNDRLEKEQVDAKLILQVHDELILEVKQEQAEYVAKLLQEEMEAAADLQVPLLAEASIGHSWYDVK